MHRFAYLLYTQTTEESLAASLDNSQFREPGVKITENPSLRV